MAVRFELSIEGTEKAISDILKVKGATSSLKKEIQSLATSQAQGFGPDTIKFLKNLPQAQREATYKQFPELRNALAIAEGRVIRPPTSASGPSGITKLLNLTQTRDISQYGNIIRGIRDVGGKDLSKVAQLPDINELGKSVKGLREVTGKDLAKVQAMGEFGVEKYTGPKPPVLKDLLRRQQKDTASFMKDMTFSMMPLLNPMSPWSMLFGTRQLFSAFMTEKGQGILGKMSGGRLSGVGGAVMATMPLVASLTAVGLALKGFEKIIKETGDSFQRGWKLFTEAGQAGLSRTFFAQRQSAADILGIQGNPNQVFMFGQMFSMITKRTKEATDTLSRNAPALAQVAVNAKIVKLDFEAMASKIGVQLAPAINTFLAAMDILIKKVQEWADKSSQIAFGIFGPAIIASKSIIEKSKTGASTLSDFARPLPSMNPFMKQLPASQMEHMGLVLGGGMGGKSLEYQRRTAHAVEMLVNMAKGKGGGMGNDWKSWAGVAAKAIAFPGF